MSRTAIVGRRVVASSSPPVVLRTALVRTALTGVQQQGRDGCRDLGPTDHDVGKQQADPRAWRAALDDAVTTERRAVTPTQRVAARRSWRSRSLATVVAARPRVPTAARANVIGKGV